MSSYQIRQIAMLFVLAVIIGLHIWFMLDKYQGKKQWLKIGSYFTLFLGWVLF